MFVVVTLPQTILFLPVVDGSAARAGVGVVVALRAPRRKAAVEGVQRSGRGAAATSAGAGAGAGTACRRWRPRMPSPERGGRFTARMRGLQLRLFVGFGCVCLVGGLGISG